MIVLVLHNNNLPFCLYQAAKFNLADDITIESRILNYDSLVQSDSFDEYISKQFGSIKGTQYDLIVLPFSFNIENYLEYTGLRVAAHIRLTPEWRKINTPILFVGPDSTGDICALSPLSGLLYSNRVFTTNRVDKSELEDIFRSISINYKVTSEAEDADNESSNYNKLLDLIHIQAPANLDSRHSIANQWAIYRWEQLFKSKYELDYDNLTHNLYIKHLIAKNKRIESFNKKFYKQHQSLSFSISDIKDKHIVYIDDEEAKGWSKLIGRIVSSSKATLSSCPFDKAWQSLSKDQLLTQIKDFIRKDAEINGVADCYIIDLRLHEEDSNPELEHTKLSGHIIAEFVKTEINKGCQIIIFTASNKSMDVNNSITNTHVFDYIVKESPEMGYSTNDTYLSLGRFKESLKKAVKLSYIKDIYSNLDSYDNEDGDHNLLYEFAELLTLDNGESNPNIIKACALTLIVFLEKFMKDNFSIDSSYNISKNSGSYNANIRGKLFVKSEKIRSKNCVVESFWNESLKPFSSDFEPANFDSDITKIIAPLYCYYKFSNETINKVVRLRRERNTNIAHGGNTCSLDITDLREIYNNVICVILKKSLKKNH